MSRIVVTVLILFSVHALAEQPSFVGPVTLDRSEQYLFPSKAVGDTLRLDVVLPIGYAESQTRYRVVYVTDSNYLLTSAAATQLAQVTDELPDMILVGIGWDVPGIPDTAQIRGRDFTPTCMKKPNGEPPTAEDLCGGADNFIAFINDELKPFVNGKYRTTDDTTLVGYSLGGLFALHVLFNHNEVFDRYVIGSASIWWDEGLLFDQEAKYAKNNTDLNKIVYLSAGGEEGEGTIPNTYRMYESLLAREYPGLQIHIDILANETHMMGINATVMRGLRSVLTDWSG